MTHTPGLRAHPEDLDALVPVVQAVKYFPSPRTGKYVSTKTLIRWMKRGYRGVKLGHTQAGHHICTSLRDIEAFLQNIAAIPKRKPSKYWKVAADAWADAFLDSHQVVLWGIAFVKCALTGAVIYG